MLVLLVGAIQLLAGLFRLGFLIRFVSNSVMTGFLNGVAVLIILGQLSDLTGYQSSFSNRVAQALDLLLHINQINLQVTTIGALTLALIVGLLWHKALRRFAFIIAIAGATVLLALLSLAALPTSGNFDAVPTVGNISAIPRYLPQLALPELSLVLSLLLPALSIAIIGLVQGAGVSQGTPNPDGRYPDVSRDFLGQGAANMATSLVGGIPGRRVGLGHGADHGRRRPIALEQHLRRAVRGPDRAAGRAAGGAGAHAGAGRAADRRRLPGPARGAGGDGLEDRPDLARWSCS